MQALDTAEVVEMARELAAVVGDPAPVVSESDLIRDGLGPERWFDCLIAEVPNQLVGYALMSRAFEAHTERNASGLGTFTFGRPRAVVVRGPR